MRYLKYLVIFALVSAGSFSFFARPSLANNLPDTDQDGISDEDEINVYGTKFDDDDTDGDGYGDWQELNSGYSPHNPEKVKLEDNDHDQDGLSDRLELSFHTDLNLPDTDGDGYDDGTEIKAGYNPLNRDPGSKLSKRIEVDSGKKQKLYYFLDDVRLGEFPVSSGVNNSTPKGNFKIDGKAKRAWSKYGLWMPYWLSLKKGYFGIHELPVWPNGAREGEDHLGTQASHGCVRLGVGAAEFIYNWAPLGTEVKIY